VKRISNNYEVIEYENIEMSISVIVYVNFRCQFATAEYPHNPNNWIYLFSTELNYRTSTEGSSGVKIYFCSALVYC